MFETDAVRRPSGVDISAFRCFVTAALFATLFLAACSEGAPAGSSETAPPAPSADRLAQLFSGELEVVDLTHALSPDAVHWSGSGDSPFEYEVLSTQPSGAVSMGAYSTPEHHGTHLDAPTHGGDNLPTVDELTAADLFGPLAVIDVSAAAAANPDYAVTREDLLAWEQRNGRLPDGAVVVMYSGWSEKYDDAEAYRNADDEGRMHFPGFSEAAARFLIDERDIRGIGADTLSVDPGAGRGFPAHGVVNGNGKYHLENVANVHLLPEVGAFVIVAPIKIAGGSGGQVRIFAVLQ
jgi:kynurenine formamidase